MLSASRSRVRGRARGQDGRDGVGAGAGGGAGGRAAAARDAGGTAEALYEKLVQTFGAKRIMWSSNYPAHPKFNGMKSRLDEAKKVLTFLSEEDRRWIFGAPALSVFPGLR